MQFPKFIFKNKFVPGDETDKKKFERWKMVVVGLMITAGILLLSTYLISSDMIKKKLSENKNVTDEISSIVHYGLMSNRENLLKISQRILPMAEVYCSIQNCIVECSFIPAASNPGIVAAVFVNSEYENHCPDNLLVEEVRFENCRFRDNALSSKWFPSQFQIKKLLLRDCSLTVINPDAFDSEPFQALSSLAIIDNGITVFRKSVFDPLPNLEVLVIQNNPIEYAEANLLAGASNALQIIEMQNAISSENVLINITGKTSLPKVLVLSLTGNSIRNVPSNIFKGVPNVQSVYLRNSAIFSIEPDAFDPFSSSVRQIFLSHNKISHLPSEIFQSILKVNQNFKLTLANNDWNCDCELQWLKTLISTYLQILTDDPRCAKPERNAVRKFSEAIFCDVNTSNDTGPNQSTDSSLDNYTTEQIDYENKVTGVDESLITLMCPTDEEASRMTSRKLLSIKEFKFRSRFPAFSVQEMENGSVYVSLQTTSLAHTLVWFLDDNVNDENSDFQDIQCITDLNNPLYLNNLRAGSTYTICLLNMFGDLTSPFNCLSLKKKETYENSLWLANEDKTLIFVCLTAILILVCLVSVIGSYYVVRWKPRLLKGSKRIIIVRHRAADAIVLPEGLRLDSRDKDFGALPKTDDSISGLCTQKDYITPISKRRLLTQRSSVISGTSSTRSSSATSYVSGIEPTSMQLMSWRIKQIRNNFSCRYTSGHDDSPPPLPPPRNKSIPSLSLNVDERDIISNDRNLVSIFATGADDQQINFEEVNHEQEL